MTPDNGRCHDAGCITSAAALAISCFLRERVQLVDSLQRGAQGQQAQSNEAAASKAAIAAALAEEGGGAGDEASKTPLLEARGWLFSVRQHAYPMAIMLPRVQKRPFFLKGVGCMWGRGKACGQQRGAVLVFHMAVVTISCALLTAGHQDAAEVVGRLAGRQGRGRHACSGRDLVLILLRREGEPHLFLSA